MLLEKILVSIIHLHLISNCFFSPESSDNAKVTSSGSVIGSAIKKLVHVKSQKQGGSRNFV